MTPRPASASDVDALAELEAACFDADAWSADALRAALGPARRAVVVLADGVLAGYAVARTAGDVVDLERIAVHPDRRRAGLGRELLAAVLSVDQRVLLEVSATNDAARAFYEAVGFEVIDRRRRYYRDGSDALVMERR